jgi:coenzyme F420-reducing hydrogenase beta subunit
MVPLRVPKPVTVAHDKAVAVQEDVRNAEADLHDTNEELADTVVGSVVTKESVQAALVQNLQVESQLHDAVKELQVVTDLLKVAEREKAAHDEDGTLAGRRSGEGVDSVLEHMKASAARKHPNR